MSPIEHYFENLLDMGSDIKGEPNKNALSREVQEAVEICADYVKYNLSLRDTKADMVAMLEELKYDLYNALCHEIHGKEEEDCPCTNQTTSCLATFRVCDANEAIYKVIQQKINLLKEQNTK